MNDKELAGKAAAILGWEGPNNYNAYGFPYESGVILWMHPHDFVRDWRVAGALMEKLPLWHIRILGGDVVIAPNDEWGCPDYSQRVDAESDSLPRAIIEACVEALND